MPEELPAVPNAPPAAAPGDDYDAICEALMQTARGRWFLQEFARRNRTADTEVLLAAIQRVEAVVCAKRTTQPPPGFRSDLLEMAKAITRTRAEVAGIAPEAASPRADEAKPAPQSRDVFAAAERIRDVTWAMRGHGFDPSTCDQLEELASSILSARALRDPADHRVSRLSEVLRYLEQRIGTLLHGEADAESASPTTRARERTPAATPLQEANGEVAPDGIAATSGSDATSDRAADGPALGPGIEPGEPAIEDETKSPSGSATYAIEATDLAAPRELEVAPEAADEHEGSVEVELEAEPEVALVPEPARLAPTAADDTPVAATTEPPEPLAEASVGFRQPVIAWHDKATAEGTGEVPPRQDSDLIRVAAVMRLAQVLFEVGSGPDAAPAPEVELDGTSEPSPAVPLAEAPPLRAAAEHGGSDAKFRPADWPADRPDAPFAEVYSPVKPAWSVAPVPTTEIAEEPAAVSAIEENPTAPDEETILPQLVLPSPRAPAIDTRDPLAALTAMSESELIALFS